MCLHSDSWNKNDTKQNKAKPNKIGAKQFVRINYLLRVEFKETAHIQNVYIVQVYTSHSIALSPAKYEMNSYNL